MFYRKETRCQKIAFQRSLYLPQGAVTRTTLEILNITFLGLYEISQSEEQNNIFSG